MGEAICTLGTILLIVFIVIMIANSSRRSGTRSAHEYRHDHSSAATRRQIEVRSRGQKRRYRVNRYGEVFEDS
jgi:hypothetical protein